MEQTKGKEMITQTQDFDVLCGIELSIRYYIDPKRQYDDLFAILIQGKERLNLTRVEAAMLVMTLGDILTLQYKDLDER